MGPLDSSMRFQETALQLREQRQQILASNIANGDTPGYQARDFDFKLALQGALSAHIASNVDASVTQSNVPLLYRIPQQSNINGNTVNIDAERNQFTDNALRYEAGMTFITNQIKTMLAAIQG